MDQKTFQDQIKVLRQKRQTKATPSQTIQPTVNEKGVVKLPEPPAAVQKLNNINTIKNIAPRQSSGGCNSCRRSKNV